MGVELQMLAYEQHFHSIAVQIVLLGDRGSENEEKMI